MSDSVDSGAAALAQARESRLNTAVAALVAISATFMALCNVKDGNVVQAMAVAQASSVDQWAYYQAKGTKQNLAEQTADQLTLQRALGGATIARETAILLDAKISEYVAKGKLYEQEKIAIKGKADGLQKEYDALNVHDDQFDMAEASLSINIALSGVTALTQKRWLLVIALAFALFGGTLGVAGFLGWSLHPDFLAKLLG